MMMECCDGGCCDAMRIAGEKESGGLQCNAGRIKPGVW